QVTSRVALGRARARHLAVDEVDVEVHDIVVAHEPATAREHVSRLVRSAGVVELYEMKAGLFGQVREPIVSAPRSGTCGLARAASEQCNSQKYASGLPLIRSFQQATTYDAGGRTADFSHITARAQPSLHGIPINPVAVFRSTCQLSARRVCCRRGYVVNEL